MNKQMLTSHINNWHFNTTHTTKSIDIYDIIILGVVIYLIYYAIF